MNEAPPVMVRGSTRRRDTWPLAGLSLDAVALLIGLILIALLLRAFIAGVFLPLSGFRVDVGDFTAWAQRLASLGPGGFYAPGYFSDYPPGYLYVLWLLGSVGRFVGGLTGTDITGGLVKIPAILADAGVAALLFVLCRRFLDGAFGGRFGGRTGEVVGLVAATVYLFNPGTIFDSAVWGQVDSVGALVILATLYLLARGWTEAAAVGAVIALLVKFQFGFLVPVVAIVGLKRHLFGRSSDPALDGRPDTVRVLTSLAAGLGSLVLLILPFRLAVWAPNDATHSLVDKLIEAANTYHGLSINAFNLWRNPWSGLGDAMQWGCDAPIVPPDAGCVGGIAFTVGSTIVTWQLVGMVLFGLAAIVALWQVARRDDAIGLLVATLVLAVAFFALPTRVHERYLFPALALAAPLVLANWRWATLYGVLSLSFFANIYWAYTADWSFVQGQVYNPGLGGLPMQRDPFLARTLFTDWGIYLLSAMIVVALVWLLWRSLRLGLASRGASAYQTDAPAAEQPAEIPVAGEPASAGTEWWRLSWLRSDPTDPLLREPMRRLDRLDLALLIGFVLFAFLFRLWRLDLPRSMHFDEVYHARSATEWLADWEHGWTRDTYEWTHPMLAKYLIAAGIVVADPNQVTLTSALPSEATALTVAPQRSAHGHPSSIAFIASGAQVAARDAVTGEQVASWSVDAPVAALAYDRDDERLLVAQQGSGEVLVFAMDAFLSHAGQRAPPPDAPPIDSGIDAVSRIVVPPSGSVILFVGPNGVGEVERTTGAPLATSDAGGTDAAYVPSAAGNDSSDSTAAHVVVSTAGSETLTILDSATLAEQRTVTLPAPAAGPLQRQGSGKDTQVFVPVGALSANDEHPAVSGGLTVLNEQSSIIDTVPLPGEPRGIAWQDTANIIYVSGVAPGGEPQVWTVDPLGDERSGYAAYDSTALPGEPLAMAVDTTDLAEGDDNANLLVATGAGAAPQLVVVDAGSNAFAWRLAGIVFGAILVGLIYLLAATMFRRRRIAVLAAAFVAVDGMSYVMSRIAMNDIYVATFIVGAYVLFWQVWSGRWQRSAWWAVPLVGILIGLAASSKWVGWYALAGLLVLVLARSALGRLLLVIGVVFLAVVAGVGEGVPWPFTVLMVAMVAFALLLVWIRPVRPRLASLVALPATGVMLGGVGLAFAIAFSQVPGRNPTSAVELVFGLLSRGAQAGWPAWILLGVSGVLLVARAAWSLLRPDSDRRWMLPSGMGGFNWPWVGACLVVIPLAVYFVSYIPYLQLGHAIALKDTGPGYGWSLDELQSQMFAYHFGLQAGHPSSSPWWSWPLDLKPTWFYGHDFTDVRQGAVIYNGGNPILFWAGIPALVWCAVQAWRRRSLALVLLVAAFAFQFLPWTRIERATFMYHYFTAVLFAMVAVAYCADELLRSRAWSSLGVAFLVAAAVVGVLVFPLGSAFAMPDWYINAAKALPPWNYYFQFPEPPQGARGQLLSAGVIKLVVGSFAAAAAGLFALYGRRWLEPMLVAAPPHGGDEQGDARGDQQDWPEPIPRDRRDIAAQQEEESQHDQDRAEDQPSVP